jgi:hypothetical protein
MISALWKTLVNEPIDAFESLKEGLKGGGGMAMTQSMRDIDNNTGRHPRMIALVFGVLAILVTALAWSGLSLKDLLAAL